MAAIAARRSSRSRCNMVAEIARDPETLRPADLRHRRHHHLARRGRVHGARRRQRAGLHRGDDLRLQDRRGDDLRASPTGWTRRAIATLDDFIGRAVPQRHRLAVPQPQLRHQGAASTRTSASSAAAATSPARTPRTRRSPRMKDGVRHFEVMDDECVGCNLCVNVCPVEDCITMVPLAAGMLDERTGKRGRPALRQLDARTRTTRWRR